MIVVTVTWINGTKTTERYPTIAEAARVMRCVRTVTGFSSLTYGYELIADVAPVSINTIAEHAGTALKSKASTQAFGMVYCEVCKVIAPRPRNVTVCTNCSLIAMRQKPNIVVGPEAVTLKTKPAAPTYIAGIDYTPRRAVKTAIDILTPAERELLRRANTYSKPACTYCGAPIEQITATHGMGAPRKVIRTEVHKIGGEMVTTEKHMHVAGKLVACPKCALEIQPTYNSKGEPNGGGIRWPNMDT